MNSPASPGSWKPAANLRQLSRPRVHTRILVLLCAFKVTYQDSLLLGEQETSPKFPQLSTVNLHDMRLQCLSYRKTTQIYLGSKTY